jgi:hypothetical protein
MFGFHPAVVVGRGVEGSLRQSGGAANLEARPATRKKFSPSTCGGSRAKEEGQRQSGKGRGTKAVARTKALGSSLHTHHFGEKLVVEEHVERRGISDLLRVGHLRLMAPSAVMRDAAIGRLSARHRILGGTVIQPLPDVVRRLGGTLGGETHAPVGGGVAWEVVVSAEGGDIVRPREEPAS